MIKDDSESTMPIRIRKTTIEKIESILKKNPAFGTAADVIDYSISMLIRLEERK